MVHKLNTLRRLQIDYVKQLLMLCLKYYKIKLYNKTTIINHFYNKPYTQKKSSTSISIDYC